MPAQQFGELPLMYSRISGPDHLDWEEWFWTMGIDFETANPLYIYDNYQFTIQAAIDGKGIALGYAGLIDYFIGRNLRGESGPQHRAQTQCPVHRVRTEPPVAIAPRNDLQMVPQ